MALLFCDGFDHYNTSYVLDKWDDSTGFSFEISSPGRNTSETYNKFLGLPSYTTLIKNLPNSDTLIVGFAFSPDSLYNVPEFRPVVSFGDNVTNQVSVSVMPSGQLVVTNGSTSGTFTILGSTPSSSVRIGTFTYVEIQVTFAATAIGSVSIQINGAPALSLTNVVTSVSGNNYANLVTLGGSPSDGNYEFDDVYICDGTGTYNNTFLGDVRVALALPAANGRVNDWSETGGTSGQNWTCVDDVPPDGDSTYVSSATVGQIDAYMISSIGTVNAVAAVQLVATGLKTDSSSRVIGLGFGNSSTDVFDSGHSLTNAYEMYCSPLDTNPLTSAPWASTDLASAEIALKVIS